MGELERAVGGKGTHIDSREGYRVVVGIQLRVLKQGTTGLGVEDHSILGLLPGTVRHSLAVNSPAVVRYTQDYYPSAEGQSTGERDTPVELPRRPGYKDPFGVQNIGLHTEVVGNKIPDSLGSHVDWGPGQTQREATADTRHNHNSAAG